MIIIIFASEAEHTLSGSMASLNRTHAPSPIDNLIQGRKIAAGGAHLWPTMRRAPKGPACLGALVMVPLAAVHTLTNNDLV